MTTTPFDSMDCTRVEALASAWVDGELAPDERARVDAHLDGCAACADLVADLAAIASEARALPTLEPSRDLWAGIAARIEAPVVALDPARVTRAPAQTWWRTAAAAAVLVAATAGITWSIARAPREAQVAAGPVAAGPVAAGPVAAGPVATGPVATAPVRVDTVVVATRDSGSRAPDERTAGDGGSSSAAPAPRLAAGGQPRPMPKSVERAAVVNVALPVAAQAYDREIAGMRTLLTERRRELDPATVRVLDRNLKIIDRAIEESRAALAQDPASGLLAEQLTRAMRRKLDLLRTAADLPART